MVHDVVRELSRDVLDECRVVYVERGRLYEMYRVIRKKIRGDESD